MDKTINQQKKGFNAELKTAMINKEIAEYEDKLIKALDRVPDYLVYQAYEFRKGNKGFDNWSPRWIK